MREIEADSTGAGRKQDAFSPGLLSRLPRPPESVAIVCASRIGDFICATPAFRALKAALPRAVFTLVGMPFIREMAELNPHIDRFEEFPGFPGIAEQFFDPRKAAFFFRRMQERSFSLAVQIHGSGVYSNIFTLMLGARYTAGFVRSGDGPGRLDAALPWPASVHAARRALALALFLGAPDRGQDTEFEPGAGNRTAADRLLAGCSLPLIGLHCGSREEDKIWPEGNFTAAAVKLRSLRGGTVVVVGGPGEQASGLRIAKLIGPHACNLAGPRSLIDMGAIIARLSVLITNDSGPAHMAYALGTPTVTLFGKTEPAEWGPPARPCHRAIRGRDRRVASITVGEVVRAAADILRGKN